MKQRILAVVLLLASVFLITPPSAQAQSNSSASCLDKEILCYLIDENESVVGSLDALSMPKINDPAWTQPKPMASGIVVTYKVEVRGVVKTDIEDFAASAAQTYADARGWSRLGVSFKRVQAGGQFTLVLSQAALMTTFSATGCDATYSCNVGNFVVINDDRWEGATPSWNASGGSLRDYHHMVINHETGHWLGHGHATCGGAGQPAPVMQQQSINLQGCKFNPWPLTSELYSPKLGI